jgi:hypothetical protein
VEKAIDQMNVQVKEAVSRHTMEWKSH